LQERIVPEARPPVPPFTPETAAETARVVEDLCNSCDPALVSSVCAVDGYWQERLERVQGRAAIGELLHRKWIREQSYRVIKEVWAFREDKIAVRCGSEWRDDSGNWFRSLGSESWEFAADGLIQCCFLSINDLPIRESERMFRWDRWAPRPPNHPSLSDFGL
jgi:nuclear transport factor 2 (NTF2) superfamily protein